MAGSKENLKISDKDNKETAKYSETGQNYSEHAHSEWDILKSLIGDKDFNRKPLIIDCNFLSQELISVLDQDDPHKLNVKYPETDQNCSEHAHTEWDILKSLISDKNSLVTISTNKEQDID